MKDKEYYFSRTTGMKKQVVEGDVERFIKTGEKIQVVEYHFPPNKVFPEHIHEEHEQMGYLVSGKMGFDIGGVKKDLYPGDWYRAPIGVPHHGWTYEEPSVLLDIFGPPRDDL